MAKAPLEIKSLARAHTMKAIQTLVDVMEHPKTPAASRVMASQALLDRGWGKAAQVLTGEEGGPLKIELVKYSDK